MTDEPEEGDKPDVSEPEGYWCVVCGCYLPPNEFGVIVHTPVPHPYLMTFDEEDNPQ